MLLTTTQRRLLPWLVAIGFFMQALDVTILNIALPKMADEFAVSPLAMQSVIIAYLLTVAVLIPASGWLADRFGTQRIYLVAIFLFTLGSLACALSPSLELLTAARVLQGIGGALLVPVGRLAILRAFKREELLRALSFVTLPGLMGPLIGPALGGWLVEYATWHWIFLINIPVGILGFIASWRYMPNLRLLPERFDAMGFLFFSVGLVSLMLGLQKLEESSTSLAEPLLLCSLGVGAIAAYWLYARKATKPLFSPQLFVTQTFRIGILGNLISRIGSGAMPFMTPLFLQIGLGYAPIDAGFSMMPTILGAMFSKSIANKLIPLVGYRRILIINTVLLGLIIMSFALMTREIPYPLLLLWLGVFGVFNSLQFSAMNILTLKDLPDTQASGGNTLLSMVMQISLSLGTASAAMLLQLFTNWKIGSWLECFHATYLIVGGLSLVASLIFARLPHQK